MTWARCLLARGRTLYSIPATRYRYGTGTGTLGTVPVLVPGANADLADQLKYHKLVRKQTGFTVTQKDRTAYVLQLQSLLSDWHNDANDLKDGDAGIEGRGIKRKVRVPAVGGASGGSKKAKTSAVNVALDVTRTATRLSGRTARSARWRQSSAHASRQDRGQISRNGTQKGPSSIVWCGLWKGWATDDEATWEPAVNISDDVLAEYEAGLDAEAELEAEEERELQDEADAEAAG